MQRRFFKCRCGASWTRAVFDPQGDTQRCPRCAEYVTGFARQSSGSRSRLFPGVNERRVGVLDQDQPANQLDPAEWPRCARCSKPVEHAECIATSKRLVFRVRCHGETQVEDITHSALKKLSDAGDSLVFGEAFSASGEPLLRAKRGALRGSRVSLNAPIIGVN